MFEKYKKIDKMYLIKEYIRDRYIVRSINIDKETGFCTVTFDKGNKYLDNYDKTKKVITQKIFNPEQLEYYLYECFNCTVLDIGIMKKITKDGIKKFVYLKFLVDDNFKIPMERWSKRIR